MAFCRLSSEQSVGDVGFMQLDWKRVPQARSRSCKRVDNPTDVAAIEQTHFGCCLHSMWSRVNETAEHLSLYLTVACGGFAAEHHAGGRYQSTVACARRCSMGQQHSTQQQMRAVHVYS